MKLELTEACIKAFKLNGLKALATQRYITI